MEAQGYKVNPSQLLPGAFLVVKPEAQGAYTVEEVEGGHTCDCAFFASNEQYGVCKHTAYVVRHKEESAHYDALAALHARPIDAADVDTLRPVVNLAAISIADGEYCARCDRYMTADELPEDFGNGFSLCPFCIEYANEQAASLQEP